jgi:hypothetical protein
MVIFVSENHWQETFVNLLRMKGCNLKQEKQTFVRERFSTGLSCHACLSTGKFGLIMVDGCPSVLLVVENRNLIARQCKIVGPDIHGP